MQVISSNQAEADLARLLRAMATAEEFVITCGQKRVARLSVGSRNPARIAMMAMTTSNSIKMKPRMRSGGTAFMFMAGG
jgi:antitoxin (DNA-binding transcriptional repressor) of toxin-antitoxin stability system